MRQKYFYFFLTLSVVITAADIVFKVLALQLLEGNETQRGGLFQIFLYKNPGIAFSIPAPLFVVVPISLALLCLLGYFILREFRKAPLRSGFASMIFFGALDNLVDRLVNGFTTDYLLFFGRSAINLADILIVTGAILLLVYTKKEPTRL